MANGRCGSWRKRTLLMRAVRHAGYDEKPHAKYEIHVIWRAWTWSRSMINGVCFPANYYSMFLDIWAQFAVDTTLISDFAFLLFSSLPVLVPMKNIFLCWMTGRGLTLEAVFQPEFLQ